MPIPEPQIKEIGPRASTAVSIDLDLINSRNPDDSYGRYCKIDGKALITISTLQAFVEQGVPMDSDPLKNSYQWIFNNSDSCLSVEPALLRANASIATGNKKYEDCEADFSTLRELVRDISINNSGSDQIPGFLLSLECLILMGETNQEIENIAEQKITSLLNSSLINPADLAYAIQIALELNILKDETKKKAFDNLLIQFNRKLKLWRDCSAETAYVIIDLSYIAAKIDIPGELKETIIAATNELLKEHQKNKGTLKLRNIPDEIGANPFDKSIYIHALILRAIIRSAVLFSEKETFALKFAHAYLKKIYEDYDATIKEVDQKTIELDQKSIELDQKTKEIAKKNLLSRIGFPVVAIAGIIFGITITLGVTKGWSTITQVVSFVSGCICIVTWFGSFYKGNTAK